MASKILRIDASARTDGSVTRNLCDRVIDDLSASGTIAVTHRDLTKPIPQIDETWVGANFTAPNERTAAQRQALELSDALVGELRNTDVIVIGAPIYNFNIPASLKAWIDQVARVGETFRYGADGPEGLLPGKRAIVTFASGGTGQGSAVDFASDYLAHILGFIGITDVTFVTSEDFETPAEAA